MITRGSWGGHIRDLHLLELSGLFSRAYAYKRGGVVVRTWLALWPNKRDAEAAVPWWFS